MKRALSSRLLLTTLALTALAVLTLAAPASAKRKGGVGPGVDGPSENEIAVRQLRQQIAAEELLIALDLSGEQKASLTALVTRMVGEREAKKAQRDADAPKLQALLEDYLAEIQADGAPSATTAQALRSFHEQRRPEPEEKRGVHEQVREELTGSLDKSQLQTLRDFRPMQAAGPTEEERGERREARRERLEERHGKLDEKFDPEDVEAMEEMHRDKGVRQHTKRVVREVLFSRPMLDALTR